MMGPCDMGPGALYSSSIVVALELRGRPGAILAIRSPVGFLVNETIRPENVQCYSLFSSHTLLFCEDFLAGSLSPFSPLFGFLCDVII